MAKGKQGGVIHDGTQIKLQNGMHLMSAQVVEEEEQE